MARILLVSVSLLLGAGCVMSGTILLAGLLGVAGVATTADETRPRVGDRVRFELLDGQRRIGVIERIDEAEHNLFVVLPAKQGIIEVPFAGLKTIEISRGVKGKAKQGAIVGALLWVALTVVWVKDMGLRESGALSWQSASLLAGGVAVGAGIGASFRSEAWNRTYLNARSESQVGLRVVVRF
jgi:hypothetical protein